MNILKVYDSYLKAKTWFDYYKDFNENLIEKVSHKDMTIHHKSGVKVKFMAISETQDLMAVKGCRFQWIELDNSSKFQYEIESELKARVRPE